MILALLLQASLFVSPVYRDAKPPESRSVRALVVGIRSKDPAVVPTDREQREALAKGLAERLRAGEDFELLCQEARQLGRQSGGTVLGTFFPGMLAEPADAFLFRAAENEVSDPILTASGFQVLQRIDRLAGCRAILIAASDDAARARARTLLERLAQGADFAELARKESADPESAPSGGAIGIFERGPSDRLLKAAVFSLEVGAFAGPIESPLGLHLVQRVDPASLDPNLADVTVVRLRAILVAFRSARGSDPSLERSHSDAEELAHALVARIRAGEDMAALAAAHDDDTGGRARSGDLGWIRRRSPQIPAVLDFVFTKQEGEVQDPLATNAGWLILRREE